MPAGRIEKTRCVCVIFYYSTKSCVSIFSSMSHPELVMLMIIAGVSSFHHLSSMSSIHINEIGRLHQLHLVIFELNPTQKDLEFIILNK